MNILAVLATATSVGLVATVAATGPGPSGRLAAEVGRAMVAGVILGSGVWPSNLVPAEIQSQLLLWSLDCERQGQCGHYGLASASPADGTVAE
jgi:hypothetical protein